MKLIKQLDESVIGTLRSARNITSLTQCTMELVMNSLDAKSTAIAVRVNFLKFQIQVIDNGCGICEESLKLLGKPYMTSKIHNLNDLCKISKHYGFRGDTISSIVGISKSVIIVSRVKNAKVTFEKTLKDDICSVREVKQRPSSGTTVTVEGIFQKLPVRIHGLNEDSEFEDLKKNLQNFIIIWPKVSFSLRNDVTGSILIQNREQVDIKNAINSLHPNLDKCKFKVLKVSKNKISIEGLFYEDLHQTNKIQYLFVNKRPLVNGKIQRLICSLFYKLKYSKTMERKTLPVTLDRKKHAAYIINIRCPFSYLKFVSNSAKTEVYFQNIEDILSLMTKIIFSHFGKENVSRRKISHKKEIINEYKSQAGVSEIVGVVKGCGFKRKFDDVNNQNSKNQNDSCFENNSHFIEDDSVVHYTSSPTKNRKLDADEKHNIKRKTFQKLPINLNNFKSENLLPLEHSNKLFKKENICARKGKKFTTPVEKYKEVLTDNSSQNCNKSIALTDNTKVGKDMILEKFIESTQKFDSEKIIQESQEKCNTTLFTNFPENEHTGRDVIMELFLKSTQIYSQEDLSKKTENPPLRYNQEQDSPWCNDVTMERNFGTPAFRNNQTSTCIKKSISRSKSHNMITERSKKYEYNRNYNIENNFQNENNYLSGMVSGNDRKYFQHPLTSPNTNHKTSDYFCLQDHATISKKTSHTAPCKQSTIFNDFAITKAHLGDCSWNNDLRFGTNFENIYENKHNVGIPFRDVQKERYAGAYFSKEDPQNELYETYISHHRKQLLRHRNITPTSISRAGNVGECKKWRDQTTAAKNARGFGNLTQPNNHFKRYATSLGIYNSSHVPNNDSNLFQTNNYDFQNPDVESLFVYSQNQQSVRNNDCNYHYGEKKLINTPKRRWSKRSLNDTLTLMKMTRNNSKQKIQSSAVLNTSVFDISMKIREKNENSSLVNVSPSILINTKSDKNSEVGNNSQLHKFSKPMNIFFSKHSIFEIVDENFFSPDPHVNRKEFDFHHSQTLRDTDQKQSADFYNAKQKSLLIENKSSTFNFKKPAKSDDDDSSQKEKLVDRFKSNANTALKNGNYWMKIVDKFGSTFYFNLKTGMTSFNSPPKDKEGFQMAKRFEFIPKGLSPILIQNSQVQTALSPESKIKLHEAILQTYENELLLTKWKNYIIDGDPKEFFQKIYTEKCSEFVKCVPKMRHGFINKEIIKLQKNVFENLDIIGQLDKKFILALDKSNNLLLAFDQHAAHERICLENLSKDYGYSDELSEGIVLFFQESEIMLLRKFYTQIRKFGLAFSYIKNGIIITAIPKCLYNKVVKEKKRCSSYMNELLQLLIHEILETINSTKVAPHRMPELIENILKTEACRGAIKFGDYLSHQECSSLLAHLKYCNFPFQCAHGRPTVTPLISLQDKCTKKVNRYCLKNLLK